jgi:hypothetical protein
VKEENMNKPLIGIKPKRIHDEQRWYELRLAISRYLEGEVRIPIEWIAEYNSLTDAIKRDELNPKYTYPKGYIITEPYRGD